MADTKPMDEMELAYFAGFFDGEGHVGIYTRRYAMIVTNADPRPLRRLEEVWGGRVLLKPRDPIGHQDIYQWAAYGHKSRPFLEAILPYTKVKRTQIEVYLSALDVAPIGRGKRYKPGAKDKIDECAARLRLLKREVA